MSEIELFKAIASDVSVVAILIWQLVREYGRHESDVAYYRGLVRDTLKDIGDDIKSSNKTK
jgi:hypothetical protein